MKFHLCCNQLEHQWEIRNKKELVYFKGSLEECNKMLKNDIMVEMSKRVLVKRYSVERELVQVVDEKVVEYVKYDLGFVNENNEDFYIFKFVVDMVFFVVWEDDRVLYGTYKFSGNECDNQNIVYEVSESEVLSLL